MGSFAEFTLSKADGLRMTVLLLATVTPGAAQEVEHIADNSFLIEEAYNQEAGVVQHINNFVHEEAGDSWLYVFTQEWPLGGMRHQLSYTVPLVSPEGFGTGLGDILLNYRYQAVGDGASALHVAPRISLVLPTGSEENGRGSGSTGMQGNLPVSYEVNDALEVHSNTGFVLDGESGALDARLGASGVLRVHPRFNVLLETVWGSDEDIVFLNPGVRWAIDAGSLQIVPGLAYTIALTSDASDAFFLYLSLEHPFRR
jgi:outer membrane putative beta-barrel porin/alpha-amylase